MAHPQERSRTSKDLPMRCVLLVAWAAVAGALPGSRSEQPRPQHRPLARREIGITASSLVDLGSRTTDSLGRSCPGGDTCGEKADNLIWDQACWDCLTDYQEFFCEKSSLTSPSPTFHQVCATEGQFRGAFCKKFAEMSPPKYYEECFFKGSEYKQLYCTKAKLKGEFDSVCARDKDVGPNYCEGFAGKMQGYIECHAWPGFMMLFCAAKQMATTWDATCANHPEVGANYCEDFALSGEIKPDCVKYASYLTLFCDIKASNNATVETCASTSHTAGMYCQELALKQNGFDACWGVPQFDSTYCAEITWAHSDCYPMSRPSAIANP